VKAKVQRWGNSLALRIPKAFAEEMGLTAGSSVDMSLVGGGLLVEPAPEHPLGLEDLLEGVTQANLHAAVDSGPAQGAEAW